MWAPSGGVKRTTHKDVATQSLETKLGGRGEAGKSSNLSRGGKQAGWQGLSHHKSQVLLEGRDNIFQVLKKKICHPASYILKKGKGVKTFLEEGKWRVCYQWPYSWRMDDRTSLLGKERQGRAEGSVGEGTCGWVWQFEYNPWEPRGRRREFIPPVVLWHPCMCHGMYSHAHVRIHTHIYAYRLSLKQCRILDYPVGEATVDIKKEEQRERDGC